MLPAWPRLPQPRFPQYGRSPDHADTVRRVRDGCRSATLRHPLLLFMEHPMSTSPNTIHHLIVHHLEKAANGPASTHLRPNEVPVSATAQRLVDHLCQLYTSRLGKGFGKFESDETTFPVPRLVRQWALDNTLDFVSFSQQMMEQLQVRAEQEPAATGGYILIAHARNETGPFLLVALVSEVIGTAIGANMDITDSVHLDMDNLRVAGRVDLDAWQQGADRYLSFLKGRGDVAQYFKLFLGCNDVVTALKETQKLVQGLENFVAKTQLGHEARDTLFARAHTYLDELGDDARPVSLDEVAEKVWPDAPAAMREALADEKLELSSGFVPDRRAIKPLMRFKAAAPGWKLEFERGALRSGDVIYNKQNDTIVLYNVPEQLRKELLGD
ncbi:Nucleoid-associated protein YejK [Amantichitinum ursilacus]|uniref:Nucleoid-associated protein YejK n=2 Tax=Amantichitinum ursilacus TaxID=857265 RepID=A0A0N0XJ82_9NEIS|nr:Nucleoid-associated protein YejK [Amantichitinum ursilacus]